MTYWKIELIDDLLKFAEEGEKITMNYKTYLKKLTKLMTESYEEGMKDISKKILKEIDKELDILDTKAFKHCFKSGKMCEECWEKKQPLIRIRKLIEEEK